MAEQGRIDPWALARAFGLYGLSGAMALGVHLLCMSALIEWAGVIPVLASGVGFAAAVPVHFAIQRYLVFRSRGPLVRQFATYATVTLAMLLLNIALFWLLSGLAGGHYLVTQLIVTGSVFVANFFINRSITFRVPTHGTVP